jgi:NTE family protein
MESADDDRDLTVVVIAGAVARGAYEAGVLADLLPKVLPNLENTVLIGTSAGAINAALWAGFAAKGVALTEVGEAVKKVWAGLDETDVFRSVTRTALRDITQGISGFMTGKGLNSLLDTSPLRATVARELRRTSIAKNIAEGAIKGVGAVATACGELISGARSHVFLQLASSLQVPKAPNDSSIDYYPAQLEVDHILASSAVPALFPPIRLATSGLSQLYVDGGIRLNTPIRPAIDLNAKRVIVVSSHTKIYPANRASPPSIGINDALAVVAHSVLADGMIEDLRKLRRTNWLVRQAAGPLRSLNQRQYKIIEYIAVAPPAGRLATMAHDALNAAHLPLFHAARYRGLRDLLRLGGAGPGRRELLSYILFDKGYAKAQFELGKSDAQQVSVWMT